MAKRRKSTLKLDVATLKVQYDQRFSLLNRLQDEALFVVENALRESSIRYHSISSRVKAFDSLISKAERLGMQRPLEQMQDVVGLRVVCLFLSEIERIGTVLRDRFEVVKEDNKRSEEHTSDQSRR